MAWVRKRKYRRALPTPECEVMDAPGIAAMLGCHRCVVWHRAKSQTIPAPITLGGVKRWRIRELRDWIDAGCPTPCVPPTWVWAPAERVSVRDYVHLLERKLVAIQDELREMEQRAANGASHVWIAKQ